MRIRRDPLIFYALAWSQVRYLYLDATLSDYLVNVLAPRLRKTLADFTPDAGNDFSSLLSWETYQGSAHLFPTRRCENLDFILANIR